MSKKRKIELIFGMTGQGKSYLAKELIQEYERVIIIDSLHEYENGIIFYSFLDFLNYWNDFKPEKFCFIIRFFSDLEIKYLFKTIPVISDLLLVVEEAEIYISPYSKHSDFLDLVRYGRHYNISILGIARRASELSVDFRAQVNRIYSFKQIIPQDVKKMEELGLSGVDTLENHKFIFVDF